VDKVLEGKVAIITGAGSGIGRASALLFAAEGATLVLGDRSEAVHDTAERARQVGAAATALRIDAGAEADVARLVGTALADHGRLDVAFANAGVSGGMAGIFELTPEEFAEVLRVNLIGPWLMVKHAGQAMAAAGQGGSIICTASVAGLRSGAGGPAYSASKAGVINLVMVSAQQLCDTGVRVNALCPGPDRNRHDAAGVRPCQGQGRDAQAGPAEPAAPRGAARRTGAGRAVPGVGAVQLRQRPGAGGRRRAVQLAPGDPAGHRANGGVAGCQAKVHSQIEMQ
jgi:NAD(P)-dependent dehydrogenase (short-subunit alcohol dehydrogenase family)